MYIVKEDKVFSLRKTSGAIVRGNLTQLWGEFFCYLFVGGIYAEGACESRYCLPMENRIGKDSFFIPSYGYSGRIGDLISKGLSDRYNAIVAHPKTTDVDLKLLSTLTSVFDQPRGALDQTSAKQVYVIAKAKGLDDDMLVVAHYVSVMFGTKDFLPTETLPFISVNVFGNIYLSSRDSVVVTEPSLVFDTIVSDTRVSPLFALVSSFAASLKDRIDPDSEEAKTNGTRPTGNPVELFGHYLILGTEELKRSYRTPCAITIPRAANIAEITYTLGLDTTKLPEPASLFYHKLFANSLQDTIVANQRLYAYIVDLMVIKSDNWLGNTDQDWDIAQCIDRLRSTFLGRKTPVRPYVVEYAVEALEAGNDTDTPSEDEAADDESDAESNNDDENEPKGTDDGLEKPDPDTEQDPETEDNSYDPAVAPPPADPNTQENTIGLISFDKTGEGVTEDLYRDAVVVLNNRLQNDETVPVDADTKEALNQWVNRFLYRAAIDVTKDRITTLGLEDYIKCVSVKG